MPIKAVPAGSQVVLRREMCVEGLLRNREAVLTTDALHFAPGFQRHQGVTSIPLHQIREMYLEGEKNDCAVIECADGTIVRFKPVDGHKYVPEQWVQAINDCLGGQPQDGDAYAAMIDTSPKAELERSKRMLEETLAENREGLEFAKGVMKNFAKGGRYNAHGLIRAVEKTEFQRTVKPQIEEELGITAVKETVAKTKRSVERAKKEATDAIVDSVDVFNVREKKAAVEAKANKAVTDKITGALNSVAGGNEETKTGTSGNDEGRGKLQEAQDDIKSVTEGLKAMSGELKGWSKEVKSLGKGLKDFMDW